MSRERAPGVTLLIAGATGLVGREVLALARADRRVGGIVAPTRRPLGAPGQPRAGQSAEAPVENPVVDFDRLPGDAGWWAADAVICALGTTIRKAGSQEAFRRVDHEYVLAVAGAARAAGARAFALTSAMGADPHSRIFYNRVKGETEAGVAACGFPSLTIVRPGLIGGERGESRPLEYAAMQVLRAVGPVLPRRYRISPAAHIARALLEAAIDAQPGRHVVTSSDLA